MSGRAIFFLADDLRETFPRAVQPKSSGILGAADDRGDLSVRELLPNRQPPDLPVCVRKPTECRKRLLPLVASFARNIGRRRGRLGSQPLAKGAETFA